MGEIKPNIQGHFKLANESLDTTNLSCIVQISCYAVRGLELRARKMVVVDLHFWTARVNIHFFVGAVLLYCIIMMIAHKLLSGSVD